VSSLSNASIEAPAPAPVRRRGIAFVAQKELTLADFTAIFEEEYLKATTLKNVI